MIQMIENGKQVGVSKVIECENSNIAYTYAIQKKQEKYIVYIDEYDLDNSYAYEDDPTEKIFIYDSFEDFIKTFDSKHDVTLDDFNISKGQKFFNVDFYI